MKILIKNGRIITATEDFIGDILIEGEKIISIGKNLKNTEGVSV
jgi:dihydropyrimidinase